MESKRKESIRSVTQSVMSYEGFFLTDFGIYFNVFFLFHSSSLLLAIIMKAKLRHMLLRKVS